MMWKCLDCDYYFSVPDGIDAGSCPKCQSDAISKP